MRKGICIGIGLLIAGCGGLWKVETTERTAITGKFSERKVREEVRERLMVRDTVVMVRAPVEESRNRGIDSSRVETSLAWSVAVWKDGMLRHTIGNFPQMPAPVRVVYRDRWKSLQDTVVKCDTLREVLVARQEVREKKSWRERVGGWTGKIIVLIMAGYLIRRKWKPK